MQVIDVMISLQQIVDLLKPVLEKQGIDKATVFGSYARGDHAVTSDIDLVIESNGKLKGIMFYAAIHNQVDNRLVRRRKTR